MADPLSAGASVIAFVGLALSSVKAIHDILSAVKDGPQTVKRLADEVKQLGDILVRLPQLQINTINSADLAELTSLSSQCNLDLSSFSAKLRRLSHSEGDRRVGGIWKRLKTAITEKDLDHMRDSIRHYTSVLNFRVALLTVAQSATQSAEMLDILRQLRTEVRGQYMSTVPDPTASMHTVEEVEEVVSDATQESDPHETKLQESIDRLIALVQEKECTVESEDAEQLIADLQTLLDSAQANEQSPIPAQSAAEVQGVSTVDREHNVYKELKLASSLIFSATSISVNSTGARDTMNHMPDGAILQQQRKRKTIDIGSGSLVVETNRRRHINEGREASTGGGGRDFIAKILFQPNSGQSLLSISVRQGQILSGSVLSIPRVLLSNIIPTGSMVFTIAAKGQVEELMSLIADGKASLQDRDPSGVSLLHCAAWNNTPMTRFLVQNGLDIDDNCGTWTPLHSAMFGKNDESLNLLLEAGADPTIPTKTYTGSISTLHWLSDNYWWTDHHNIMLDSMFRHSRHFGLSTYRDHMDRTPLLRVCQNGHDSQRQIQQLAFLLSKGCSISDVDYYGFNCLQVFFTNAPSPEAGSLRDFLVYLVGQGADVYATDRLGRSVSQLAYSKTCWSEMAVLGSYCGDLWDAVLDLCGYSVLEFRKGYPRRAIYTRSPRSPGWNYSRVDFERLWEGREHRCPYWDDAEWQSPEDGGHDDSPGVLDMPICVCGKVVCAETAGLPRYCKCKSCTKQRLWDQKGTGTVGKA
ncbi:ankyrin [Coniochaeta ligniaria NRRL 30616]|uniref:Ankyrin n=1 Tax=Coniochaeta ligniaria NRRL 30616 TaxID=1408157 RepID=A0A1J7J489_9PEZI|nr:ankyrin [Coniochaeta ligniaria NRRL 30616]